MLEEARGLTLQVIFCILPCEALTERIGRNPQLVEDSKLRLVQSFGVRWHLLEDGECFEKSVIHFDSRLAQRQVQLERRYPVYSFKTLRIADSAIFTAHVVTLSFLFV